VLDPFFIWVESSWFSVWVRDSPSLLAFPAILTAHTIGLGLIAGMDIAHDLRVLGAAPRIPVVEFNRFLPIMWFGLWLNVITGICLIIAYPTKALTNPVFYLKLTLIAIALLMMKPIRRAVAAGAGSTKRLAVASLVCWAGAITAGWLLAYTYSRLTALDNF